MAQANRTTRRHGGAAASCFRRDRHRAIQI